jgi:hypothetical protein
MNRRHLLQASAATALFALLPLGASAATPLRLIKDPNCGCCQGHALYLQQNGFAVTVEASADLDGLRRQLGIPPRLVGCHTILAEGYVIEGHVPAAAIAKLLSERPAIKGISVPGMPQGSPGMSGEKTAPLVVYTIADADTQVFFTE